MTFTADATQKLLQLGASEDWTIDYDNGTFTLTNDVTGNTFDFDGNGEITANFLTSDELNLTDSGVDPSADGEIRNNNGVIRARSGGSVDDILATGAGGDFSVSNIEYVKSGDTVESAITTVGGGGRVVITGDYDPSFETFPINVNHKVEIVMMGADRLVNPTTNDATPKDTFLVDLGGPNEFPGPMFRNVTVEGGRDAFNCTETRYVTFDHCLAEGMNRHGWNVRNTGTTPTSYVYNRCVGEDAATGDGWHLEGNTIGHTWFDCTGEQNGGAAIRATGVLNRATIYDGSWQLNGDEAFDFSNGFNASQILGAYIEANDENQRNQEVIIDNAFAWRVEGCRFNGFSNNMDAFIRGPNYGKGGAIANCAFLNYGGTGIDIQGGRDQDIHIPSHYYNSVTTEFTDAGLRTRSNGVQLMEDGLGAPGNAGQFNGDLVVADPSITTSGNAELAVWNSGSWYTWGGDTFTP